MNTQQAKFILQSCRPDGADAGDATFREALVHAQADAALHDWFAREQAFDRAISAKLGEVPVPAGLRETILAGGRASASAAPRRQWWVPPVWLAVAASVALLLGLTLAFWPGRGAADGSLVEFALADARFSMTHGHEGRGAETDALQAMLSQSATRLGGRLPVDFAALRKTGCRTLSFQKHDVLEVCFKRDGIWFHCYIGQRVDFPELAAVAAPALADRDGSGIASWADGSLVYVVVSKAGRAALERLL